MVKGWIVEVKLNPYEVEIDGKKQTHKNDYAFGVMELFGKGEKYFEGTIYTPVDCENCTKMGDVTWSYKEFAANVDTWHIVKEHFIPGRRKKRKSLAQNTKVL